MKSAQKYCRNCPRLKFMFEPAFQLDSNYDYGKHCLSPPIDIVAKCTMREMNGRVQLYSLPPIATSIEGKDVGVVMEKATKIHMYYDTYWFDVPEMPKNLLRYVDRYLATLDDCIIPYNLMKDYCLFYAERSLDKWSDETEMSPFDKLLKGVPHEQNE